MKKLLSLLFALAMVMSLAACGSTPATETPATEASATEAPAEPAAEATEEPAAEPVELIVFAAASMTETMTEIAELYKAVAPEVTITYNFDSSGTLLKQIA